MHSGKDRTLATSLLASLILCSPVTPVVADTAYKWVDREGRVIYQDEPPPADARQVEEKPIQGGSLAPQPAAAAAAQATQEMPVVLYSAPACDLCDAARAYLQERGVPFTEHDVAGNPDKQDIMRKQVGELTVPALVIGEKVMKGYMKSLLEAELDAAGYPRQPAQTEPVNPVPSEVPAPVAP